MSSLLHAEVFVIETSVSVSSDKLVTRMTNFAGRSAVICNSENNFVIKRVGTVVG